MLQQVLNQVSIIDLKVEELKRQSYAIKDEYKRKNPENNWDLRKCQPWVELQTKINNLIARKREIIMKTTLPKIEGVDFFITEDK